MPTHVAVGSPSPHSDFVPCTMLKTVGHNCRTPLGSLNEKMLLQKVDQHQSQSEMLPSQPESRASPLQPGPKAASPSTHTEIQCYKAN